MEKVSSKHEKLDSALGDRAITVGEILNHPDRFNDTVGPLIKKAGNKAQDIPILEILQKYNKALEEKGDKELLQRFQNLVVDPYIRINDAGEIYSLQPMAKLKHQLIKQAADTLPGKILKLRVLDMAEETPAFFRIKKGTISPVLAALEKGNTSNIVNNDYFYIAGEIHQADAQGKFHEEVFEGLSNVTTYSTRYGSFSNLTKGMFELEPQRVRDDHSLTKILDLNASPEANVWEKLNSIIYMEKDEDYLPEVLKDLPRKGALVDLDSNFYRRYNHLVDIQEMMDKRTRGLERHTLNSIAALVEQMDFAPAKEGQKNPTDIKELLNILLTDNDEDMLEKFKNVFLSLEGKDKDFSSPSLTRLTGRLARDEDAARSRIKLVEDISNAYESTSGGGGLDFFEQLRYGLSQELLLSVAEKT